MEKGKEKKFVSSLALKIARHFLSVLFMIVALLKIPQPEQMKTAIQSFRVVNENWAIFGSYFFPWMEFWSGVGLLLPPPYVRRAAALIILGLLTLFIFMLILAKARGLSFNCGCFGSYRTEGAPDDVGLLIVRDLGLWALAVVIFLFPTDKKVH